MSGPELKERAPMGDRVAPDYELSHVRLLEAEAIHIIREVATEFERPVLLFSGGKDSIVMLHLAVRAFQPGGCRFRCCTWTPDTTSRRSSPSATGWSPRPGCGWSWARCRTTSTPVGSVTTARRATPCRRSRCCAASPRAASMPRSRGAAG